MPTECLETKTFAEDTEENLPAQNQQTRCEQQENKSVVRKC